MHEWIGPTIEHELGEVLEWRGKSEASRSQVVGTVGDLTFDDDGSNLRIRSAKKQVVQIIKVGRVSQCRKYAFAHEIFL